MAAISDLRKNQITKVQIAENFSRKKNFFFSRKNLFSRTRNSKRTFTTRTVKVRVLVRGTKILQIPCYHISPNLGTDTHCPLCDTATPDSFTPFFMVWHIQLKPSHSSKNQPTTEMTFLRCPKCNYQCLRVCRWSSPSCSWRYSLQRSSFNMPNAYF